MRRPASIATALAAAVTILGAALLVLMTPPYLHAALDVSGSAEVLGTSPGEAHRLSDETVSELFFGPGTFAEQWRSACPDGAGSSCAAVAGQPFYDPAEVRHMQDVRTVLWGFLAVVAAGLIVLAVGLVRLRREGGWWRSVARGAGLLAVGTVIVGALFAVAFEPMFTLFHEIFFPGGDWSFDPATERLVQLYPIPFWELTTGVLAALTVAGGLIVWWLARGRARSLARLPDRTDRAIRGSVSSPGIRPQGGDGR